MGSTRLFLDRNFDCVDREAPDDLESVGKHIGIGSVPGEEWGSIIASRDSAVVGLVCAIERWYGAITELDDTRHFVTRITSISSCSPEAVVIASIFWHRAARHGMFDPDRNPQAPSADIAVTTCVMTASKSHDELYGDNRWFSNAAGLDMRKLNAAEIDLYTWMDWKLTVTPSVFKAAVVALEAILVSSPPKGPMLSMTPSPSLAGSIGCSGPCGLMLTPCASSPSLGSSAAKLADEDLGDRIFRQALLHCNDVKDAWSFIQNFERWCQHYNPDEDEVNKKWMHALLDIGFDESMVWTVLHWGLVLCQDQDSFLPCIGDTPQTVWSAVVANTPSDPCVVAKTMSCSFGPGPRPRMHLRRSSDDLEALSMLNSNNAAEQVPKHRRTRSDKGKPSEWTYHLMDVHRHVGKAADIRLKSSSSYNGDECKSNCVSWHMQQGHKKLMGQEAQKLVQDAALLENCLCANLEDVGNGDNPDIDDVTRKAQLLLTHFDHDQRTLIDTLVSPPSNFMSVAG